MLDTYTIFGCDSGEPTFRYSLEDGVKDGYKCIFKRQGKGKDVTVFQPSPVCQKSFKCKTETQ